MPDSGVCVLGLTRRGTQSRKRAAWPGAGVGGVVSRPPCSGLTGRRDSQGGQGTCEAHGLFLRPVRCGPTETMAGSDGRNASQQAHIPRAAWLYRTHLRHRLGGRPSSSRPGHFPSTTHRRGVFAYGPGHRSPAIRNPPSNNRCRQTFFPPVPGRDALFQFPQNLEVVTKNVTKGLQNRVGKKCYTVLGDAALRPRADDPQTPSPQPRASRIHKRRKPGACP